ncbi:hypothetical protein FACS1894190_18320 [Spirochaetia bacterium]|nr:hypothetical protein FACS1894190_18320 [Spirochaetia bacterium]
MEKMRFSKVALCLVILLGLGTAVSADGWFNGWKFSVEYLGNMSSKEFWERNTTILRGRQFTSKLPRSAFQTIGHALATYQLDVDDVFDIGMCNNPEYYFSIIVRITNRNGDYKLLATQTY